MPARSSYFTRVAGTGSYLPQHILSNQDLEKMVDTTDAWILERTGIAFRHIADQSQATSDLAYAAAMRALEAANLSADKIDAILVATVTGDQPMPSTACMLQTRLGCRSIMALDISAACSGFIYGVSIADQYIKTGMYQHILVVGAETLSRVVNYKDRQTCILFGDGGGAVILSRVTSESPSCILSSHLGSNGEFGDILKLMAGGSRMPFSQSVLDQRLHLVQMKGREVFKAAVRAIVECCQQALSANHMTVADVDWFIVHQANTRIIEAVGEILGISEGRRLVNIRDTGNTSSASIPILFDQTVRENKIQRSDVVLLAAFGGGLTSGSVVMRY